MQPCTTYFFGHLLFLFLFWIVQCILFAHLFRYFYAVGVVSLHSLVRRLFHFFTTLERELWTKVVHHKRIVNNINSNESIDGSGDGDVQSSTSTNCKLHTIFILIFVDYHCISLCLFYRSNFLSANLNKHVLFSVTSSSARLV